MLDGIIRARYDALVQKRIGRELDAVAALWDEFYDELAKLRRECLHGSTVRHTVLSQGHVYRMTICTACRFIDYTPLDEVSENERFDEDE